MKWDIDEAVLLVGLYWELKAISKNHHDRLISEFSEKLRGRARNLGVEVNDTFRNVNGIKMQLQNIEYLVTDGKTGLSSASSMFKVVVAIYKDEKSRFDDIYNKARNSLSGNRANTEQLSLLQSFHDWLVQKHKISSAVQISVSDIFCNISEFALKLSMIPLYSICDIEEFRRIKKLLLRDKFFQIRDKMNKGRYLKTVEFYEEFLEDKSIPHIEPDTEDVEPVIEATVLQDIVTEEKVIDTIDTTVEMNNLNPMHRTVDFSDCDNNFRFTKPCVLVIQGSLFDVKSWNDLYVQLCNYLVKTQPTVMCSFANDHPLIPRATRVYFSNEKFGLASPKKLSNQTWVETNFSAKDIVRMCELLLDCCEIPHNELTIKYIVNRESKKEVQPYHRSLIADRPRLQLAQATDEKLESVVAKYFGRGFKLNSAIDTRKLRSFYEQEYDKLIALSDAEISQILQRVCIEYEAGRVMAPEAAISSELLNQIIVRIRDMFDAGATLIYFESLYQQFRDELFDTKVYNGKILKQVLEFFLGSKYVFRRSCIAFSNAVVADSAQEIRELLVSNTAAMSVDEINDSLPHIPERKIKSILLQSQFVNVDIEVYSHIDCFPLTEDEVGTIRTVINEAIGQNGFIHCNVLFERLTAPNSQILELHSITTAAALRNIIAYYLADIFDISSSIIGQKDSQISVAKILEKYCDEKDTVSLDELEALADEIGVSLNSVYLEGVLKKMLRVDEKTLCQKDQYIFDVEATDAVLSKFMNEEYLPICRIDRYSLFPSAGIDWNTYLLESYVQHFSKIFKILSFSRSITKSVGVIVRKDSVFSNYNGILADAISQAGISDENTAISYLCDKGFISKRRMKNISAIMQMAKTI